MKRNGILMSIWVLLALTLVVSATAADRGDRGGRDKSPAQSVQPADQTSRPSSQPAKPATSAKPPQNSGSAARGVSSARPGQSAPAQKPAATSSGDRGSKAGAASSGARAPQPNAGIQAGSTQQARRSQATGPAAPVQAPKPVLKPTVTPSPSPAPSAGSRSLPGRTQDKVTATQPSPSKPAFTPRTDAAQREPVKSGDRALGTVSRGDQGTKPAFTPPSPGIQGGAKTVSERDRVGGGTQPGGRDGGGTVAKPEYGPQTGAHQPSTGSPTGGQRDLPHAVVDGRRLDFPRDPEQRSGHWMAPSAPFFDRIGARTWEDPKDNWWHAQRDGHEFRFRVGDRHGFYDGREILFPEAPYLIGGYLYCPLDIFALYFEVPYTAVYEPYPVLVYTAPGPAPRAVIGQGLAIVTAGDYLKSVGAYPTQISDVTAHLNTAPANRFWDAVTSGHDPLDNGPMVWCWVVEFQYPGGWQQVFVDATTDEVVGGSAS